MDKTSSKTAVLVCQGRAVADGRLAPTRFSDATARALLTDVELVPVERARGDDPPKGLGIIRRRRRTSDRALATCHPRPPRFASCRWTSPATR